ncbi:restriction endonuclease subunit S [Nodosilinea sp. P-1105]|uniref:restriction endonuclease subunit S n=1 Tax=Nodosilinea sp. P-1105 TaxID=2546229 RepID=UPI00146BA457|nr:restriction endonuclease subunit S [Nodosilinea sp. P-1105]NMF86714.1 restriction endonuclease subunit S [Nodosilinea sp. P-1105]
MSNYQLSINNYQLPEGYKQTEAGVIPEDWNIVLLDLVTKRGSGHTPDKKRPEYWNGGIKWISLKDSDGLDNLYINDTADETSALGIANSSAVIHPAGTVVLSRDAGVGKSAIMGDDMAVSQHFMAWQCSSELNNHFLYFWLQTRKPEFERIAIGNTIKTIGLPYFKELTVLLPPLREQNAIATTLSDVDALIAALDKLIAKQRHLKTATMQQLLTGKKRLPGFGEGKWSTRQQKEVCSYINGRAYQRTEWETNGIPVVRLQNLTGSGEEYYYSNLNLPEHQYMDYGDLIFMWSASFGPCIWKGEKAIYHYHIWKIDCDSERIDKIFYYYKLVELTENIKKGSNGSTMAHVTKGEMENFSIKLPEDVEEQRAIATVLSDMDAAIAALETRRAKTQAIKQGMMQELLTGRTRLV